MAFPQSYAAHCGGAVGNGGLQGFCHLSRGVGIHVERRLSSGLLKARAFGCHCGYAAFEGFEDGDAESFVERWIGRRRRLLADGCLLYTSDAADDL